MSSQRRDEPEKSTASSTFFSFIYFILVIVASFFIAGFVMGQTNLRASLGLDSFKIPLINVPGSDIPDLALQLVLAFLIFFVLQLALVSFIGLFKKKKDPYESYNNDPWSSGR
jgi:hypothetical protein